LSPQGLPAHRLALKVGQPIILIRNLDQAVGLANGTRLVVTHLTPSVVFAEIITGPRDNIGKVVAIPRLDMSTSGDPDMPFRFKRRQFPVRQAFAITINKSQGQSLERVGVWLKQAVFAHGQLYVALSRCGSRGGVRIALCPSAVLRTDASGAYVTNVVYYEVLGLPPPGTAMLCDVSEVDDADLAAAGDVIEAMMAAGGSFEGNSQLLADAAAVAESIQAAATAGVATASAAAMMSAASTASATSATSATATGRRSRGRGRARGSTRAAAAGSSGGNAVQAGTAGSSGPAAATSAVQAGTTASMSAAAGSSGGNAVQGGTGSSGPAAATSAVQAGTTASAAARATSHGATFICGAPIQQLHALSWFCVPLIRAALGLPDNAHNVLRAAAGAARWDSWVAAYAQDFRQRGVLAAHVPFDTTGYVGPQYQEDLLFPIVFGLPSGQSNVDCHMAFDMFTWAVQNNVR
jgi:hypothetical protein